LIRTRFAPSPTGDLHLGGAWTALASWTLARRRGEPGARAVQDDGRFVLRMEDLDPPRVVRGAAARIEDDLRWLGLDWDEGPGVGGPHAPYTQSERGALYEAALEDLTRRGLTYACDCSRSEIAQAASAPHPPPSGEEAVYPGYCRDRGVRPMKRDPAVRLRVAEGPPVTVVDGALGPITQDLARDVGDFVLRRGDGVFAYQLAVVVDDLAMAITDVVRGADLAASAPRQAHLARLLGGEPPRYVHLPLVVASDGARLAKRTGGARVRALREAGLRAEAVVGTLAHALGLAPDAAPRTPRAVADLGAPIAWPRAPWRIPAEWARLAG
jgi:glutamyl-tRNA synthetase